MKLVYHRPVSRYTIQFLVLAASNSSSWYGRAPWAAFRPSGGGASAAAVREQVTALVDLLQITGCRWRPKFAAALRRAGHCGRKTPDRSMRGRAACRMFHQSVQPCRVASRVTVGIFQRRPSPMRIAKVSDHIFCARPRCCPSMATTLHTHCIQRSAFVFCSNAVAFVEGVHVCV